MIIYKVFLEWGLIHTNLIIADVKNGRAKNIP